MNLNKKTAFKISLYNILRYSITIICIVMLIYKIATIDDWNTIANLFTNMSSQRLSLLAAAVLLLALNVLCEAYKWQIALYRLAKISFSLSFKSVLWGYTGAFITPNSLGEYPTRSLHLSNDCRARSVLLGFFSSAIQTAVISICGVIGLIFWLDCHYFYISQWILFGMPMLFVILIVAFLVRFRGIIAFFTKIGLHSLAKYTDILLLISRRQIIALIVVSILKFSVFSVQFLLILSFCGLNISWSNAMIDITVFYLFMTYIPLMNLFEVAVRSSVAIIVFGSYTETNTPIVFGSIIFWLLNFCMPTVIGLFVGCNPYKIVNKA
ncbi:MAG: hypothetical protein CSA89_01560 [Bacteroidales bacterium]|nr:MAG: hypothetical protein CSA89_01560 [Bacteroidales bacterium]